ncbi:MAG: hypothetical protein PVG39_23920 [Desulfobacteraceae bacterium]|jgi:hypothetical protein
MWHVERIINFGKSGQFQDGFARFGFHDSCGTQYVLAYSYNWIGALSGNDQFLWTAGEQAPFQSLFHFDIDLLNPSFISECHDGSLVVSGKNGVYKLDAATKQAEMIINAKDEGLEFIGNAVVDNDDCIWINDVCACKIHRYNPTGKLLEILGTGESGFTPETVSFKKVSFNWIYDLRMGSDGNLYVLDSKNYAVRMININNRLVSLVAGTGEPGYSGDGGPPLNATFGGNDMEQFDGPWSLSLDEENNIYIGDTQNHVVRMIDRRKNKINTIAGNPNAVSQTDNNPGELNPLKLNLHKICSLDYFNSRLFIPEWDGDLIVLNKT